MTTANATTPVRKSISVRAGVDRPLQAFTTGIDDWWPRQHHIGEMPMKKTVIEDRLGGCCYTEHTGGSESEVRFTLQADGTTRVELEHRNFERMGDDSNDMRMMVESPSGSGALLDLYAACVENGESQ